MISTCRQQIVSPIAAWKRFCSCFIQPKISWQHLLGSHTSASSACQVGSSDTMVKICWSPPGSLATVAVKTASKNKIVGSLEHSNLTLGAYFSFFW